MQLQNLRSLTHLRLLPHVSKNSTTAYPPPNVIYGLDVTEPVDIARCYAMEALRLCPTLRYIMIGEFAWKVVFPLGSGGAGNVGLLRLGKEEMRGIELFYFEGERRQCGLVGYV